MSFIDTFKHEHIGFVTVIPIYLPSEKITGEFEADTSSILLGGGSGELSAYVMSHGDVIYSALDLNFYESKSFDFSNTAKNLMQTFGVNEDDYCNFLDELLPQHAIGAPDTFNYPEWSGDEWYSIVTAAISDGYDTKSNNGITAWLEARVGEKMLNEHFDRVTEGLSANAMKFVEIGTILNSNLGAARNVRLMQKAFKGSDAKVAFKNSMNNF